MIVFEKDKAFSLFEEVEQGGYIGQFDGMWVLKVNDIYSITINYDRNCDGMYCIRKNGETIKWEHGIKLSFSKEKYIDRLENTAELAINTLNKIINNSGI